MSLREFIATVSPNSDCAAKLSDLSGLSSLQISTIAEELARKTEDASRQQEEITHLLSQIVDLQKKAKSVSLHHAGPRRHSSGVILLILRVCAVRSGERGADSAPGGGQRRPKAANSRGKFTSLRCTYCTFFHIQALVYLPSHSRAAPGVGGEILRVHRDAARSPGGAEEPQEPELSSGDPSALPSAGTVPHGESLFAFLHVLTSVFYILHGFLCSRTLWQLRSREQ